MLLLLHVLTCSKNVTDRNFVFNNPNFTGSWEYWGASGVFDSKIFLNVNNGTDYSILSYQDRLSSANWSIDFEIDVSNSKTSNGIGFWITKNYAAEGDVFGGPLSFSGVSLLIYFNGSHILSELRHNDGKFLFYPGQFFPQSVIPASQSNLSISIGYHNRTISVCYQYDDQHYHLFEENTIVELRKNWLFVSTHKSSCNQPVLVNYAFISKNINEKTGHIEKTYVEFHSHDHEKPISTKANKTHTVREYTVADILQEISSLGLFAKDMSTRKEIRSTVWKSMFSYSNQWQRRSISIVQNTSSLRSKIQESLKQVEDSITTYKDDVDSDIKKFKEGIHEIESELYFGVLGSNELNHQLKAEKKMIKNGGIINKLIWASIIEVVAIIIILVIHMAFF